MFHLLNSIIILTPLIQIKVFFMYSMNYISISFFIMNIIFLTFLWNITKNILLFSKNYMLFWSVYFNTMIILFVVSMILLIISNSWLLLFLGWELLGLTSFILIIYYNNWNSLEGSLLTMMTNRLGDMFFMLSLMFFFTFKSMFMTIIIIMMALTKSSQFPFSSWLPAAMAAPTPVSALVHSSTLVTAGIYVFFRFNLMMNFMINKIMVFMFMMTMLMGSLSALIEADLKKIIAFSTLSQLGLIFLSFYASVSGMVFMHLLVHAIFKSILFVIAGLIIWSMCSQSLLYSFNLTISLSCLMIVSIINMMGFVFTSGFLSKDLVIFSMSIQSCIFYLVVLTITMLTIFYSLRLILSMLPSFSLMKNCINFKMASIKMFYIVSMLLMGRFWVNNLNIMLSWTILSKVMLMLLFMCLILRPVLFSIFKNLNNLNLVLSKILLMDMEKDYNFFMFMVYSFQVKMVNMKFLALTWIMMILL